MPETQNLNTQQKQEVKQEVAVQTAKIEQKLEKQAEKKIEKEVKQEVKQIEQKLKKKLGTRLIEGANSFNKELKNQTATAITAAFAFLIALSWRTPIQNSVDNLITRLNLTGSAIYLEYLSAVIITLIAVIFLMLFSKWKSEKK